MAHIILPEHIAHDDRYEAGIHEGDEGGARRPAEVAPAILVQLFGDRVCQCFAGRRQVRRGQL